MRITNIERSGNHLKTEFSARCDIESESGRMRSTVLLDPSWRPYVRLNRNVNRKFAKAVEKAIREQFGEEAMIFARLRSREMAAEKEGVRQRTAKYSKRTK